MPRVRRLSIAPVRALGLQHPASIDVDAAGVREDRRFFLIDEHNHIVDRLRAGSLVQVQARTDPEATWLRLSFPDGTIVAGDVVLGEAVQTHIYGREAFGHVVDGPWAAALQPFAHDRALTLIRCDNPGGTRIRGGETQVRNAVSLISDASLAELSRQLGVDKVDGRRFRMLIELEGAGTAHEEDTWIGGQVAVGSAVLEITKPDARCAITTQDPDTGERDLDTLRTILRYRGFRANNDEKRIDFGVLGEVAVPGRISVGDELRVLAARGDAAAAEEAIANSIAASA
ncbi:MAG TPA: MOSC domain-containing protein [Candidatus Limnocylindrales bacterium]|nr:MOSC domain-containing protein [Candidatus Limnocylindrales bacterium]